MDKILGHIKKDEQVIEVITMKVHVVVGIYQGIIEDVSVHKYFNRADEKEEEVRRKYGLPEVKEEREEDHQEKEVRRFAVDLEN